MEMFKREIGKPYWRKKMYRPEIGGKNSKWTLTAKQQKELEKQEWEVIPNARFLDLYHDDFQDGVWDEVCQVFDKENIADKLTLLVVGVKTNE